MRRLWRWLRGYAIWDDRFTYTIGVDVSPDGTSVVICRIDYEGRFDVVADYWIKPGDPSISIDLPANTNWSVDT